MFFDKNLDGLLFIFSFSSPSPMFHCKRLSHYTKPLPLQTDLLKFFVFVSNIFITSEELKTKLLTSPLSSAATVCHRQFRSAATT